MISLFLPCRRGIAMRKLSVCPSVCSPVRLSVRQTRKFWIFVIFLLKIFYFVINAHYAQCNNGIIFSFESHAWQNEWHTWTSCNIFTALHGMQTRSSDENSVCLSVRPSVRPSVTRVDCDKAVERSVQIYIPSEKKHLAQFSEKKNGGGAAPSTWNFGSTGPRWSKIADFEPIIARSVSAVTLSEKSSINANRKSTTRFPMSLRWSLYVAPKSPKGGLKNAKRPICVKNRTSLEESLLHSFFVWKLSAAKL